MAKITEEIEREKELQAGQHCHHFFFCNGIHSFSALPVYAEIFTVNSRRFESDIFLEFHRESIGGR
jgi:hypothetical protein